VFLPHNLGLSPTEYLNASRRFLNVDVEGWDTENPDLRRFWLQWALTRKNGVSQVEVGKIERYEIVCAVLNFVCYHDVVVTGVGCDIGQHNLRIPAHTITGGLKHEFYRPHQAGNRVKVCWVEWVEV